MEEVSSVYRDGYLAALARSGIIPLEQCRGIVEGLDDGRFTRRAAGVLTLVNSMPRSPTVEEIREALRAATVVNADAPAEKDEQEDDDDEDEDEEEELTREGDAHPEGCECEAGADRPIVSGRHYICRMCTEREYDPEREERLVAELTARRAERIRKAVPEKFPHLSPAEQQAMIDALLAQKVHISICS